MTAPPSVVVALTQPPSVEGGANGRCSLALLRGLQDRGVGVHVVSPTDGSSADDLVAALPPSLRGRVEFVDPPAVRARAQRVRRPLLGLAHGEFLARVQALAREADVLHLDQLETAWCGADVRVPSLLYLHYRARLDRRPPAVWRRDFRFFAERALAERAHARRQRYLVANSPVVAASLRASGARGEIVLVPLCLDPAHYEPAPLTGPAVFGIIGTGWWPPTAAAIRRVVTRTWPLIRRARPAARLVVAGRGTDALGLPETDGVEVLGPTRSAAEFLQGISALLYPLDRGSGMKVKVLECLASGVPVVTTRAGAEGVPASDGVIVEVTDDAMARAAISLVDDPVERLERGRAARATFLERFAPGPATEPLVDLYTRMAT